MKDENKKSEFEIVSKIISLLENIEKEKQIHILTTVGTWLRIDDSGKPSVGATEQASHYLLDSMKGSGKSSIKFSGRKDLSPKQFMLEKQPRTDVERLACLAYYLTHYRDTPQFKTIDLSKLNTEAAQRKFSNATVTAKNAARTRYFVPASKKGHRQLSADGEQIIAALPDREAIAAIRQRMRPRKTTKKRRRKRIKVESK